MPTQRKPGLTNQTRENADGEIIHDKTVSTRQIAGTILLPGKWERLPQALHAIQERCSQPEALTTRLEAVPAHVNACHGHRRSIQSVFRPTEVPRPESNFN